MIPEIRFDTSTSMMKFNSVPEVRKYLKRLLEDNLRESDRVGQVTAMMMREGKIDSEKPSTKGWVKTGGVFVNKTDPEKAVLDSLFALVREVKPRITQIQDALKAADKLGDVGVTDEDAIVLYVKFGSPERFVVVKADPPDKSERFELRDTYITSD